MKFLVILYLLHIYIIYNVVFKRKTLSGYQPETSASYCFTLFNILAMEKKVKIKWYCQHS